MPRKAREKSSTGIYHIMLRGIDGRNIFLDKEDKEIFLKKLLEIKDKVNFKLYGYCLMDNHIHLLLGESEEIGTTMKRITVAYVHWNNNKYGRTGHLFQNRYLSEPVETEKYLLAVLRYIHRNPIAAGLDKDLEGYPWSSHNQYIAMYEQGKTDVNGHLITAYLKDCNEYIDFMNQEDHHQYLEHNPAKKYTDQALYNFIQKEYRADLMELDLKERNKQIQEMYKVTGVSMRQLGRVLGVGKGVIEAALRQDK